MTTVNGTDMENCDLRIEMLRMEFAISMWRGRAHRFRRLFIGAATIGAIMAVVAATEALVWWVSK